MKVFVLLRKDTYQEVVVSVTVESVTKEPPVIPPNKYEKCGCCNTAWDCQEVEYGE